MKTISCFKAGLASVFLTVFLGLWVTPTKASVPVSQSPSVAWSVAMLDEILSNTPPGQALAQIGDEQISVSYLQNWRDYLANSGNQPELTFASSFVPWTGGNVYYAFDSSVDPTNQKVFIDCCAEWATFVNLHFIPRTSQANYIIVTNNPSLNGGLSSIGMIGGPQLIQLGTSAWSHAVVVHEIGHALGLVHEFQRSDRDNFVIVNSNNVASGELFNFVLLTGTTNKTSYDFLSVMHYARNAFSVNANLDTIIPLPAYTNYLNLMGQQHDPVLSSNDRVGVISIYGAGPGYSSVVTNTQDSGPGTLRTALYYAFDHPNTTITFNIPNTDSGLSNNVFNIMPSDAFPSLVHGTTLDGSTQPSNPNPSGPAILLNGARSRPPSVFSSGLSMKGSNCVIKTLTINNFMNWGVLITSTNAQNNSVTGCYLGTDPTGTIAVTNRLSPVEIDSGAVSNTIGGSTVAQRNIISGSGVQGVLIRDAGTSFNSVKGNYIGLNAAGTVALANIAAGIEIFNGATGNTIGGLNTGEANVISGNLNYGITLLSSSSNSIVGNLIGLNAAGTAAIPNSQAGITAQSGASYNTIGGLSSGSRNVISGNTADGIFFTGSTTIGNLVEGNYLGVNPAGTSALGNNANGVDIQGSSAFNTVMSNVISGNLNYGITLLACSSNSIGGNLIGLNAAGTAAIANSQAGITAQSGASYNTIGGFSTAARNVISGNANDGIFFAGSTTTGNLIEGNYIGVSPAGTSALGNTGDGIDIQGSSSFNIVADNLVSGNLFGGMYVSANNNSIWGNFVGVNAAGNAALVNQGAGIFLSTGASSNTIGGVVSGMRNVISGNQVQGIALSGATTTKNLIQGNYIGLNAAGTAAITNLAAGIEITSGSYANTIGGLGGARNFISGNGYAGININNGGSNNIIQGNTIGLNGTNGRAIGNAADSIVCFAGSPGNIIGGTTPGSANIIAAGINYGVDINDAGSSNNVIRGNSIFSNSFGGITLNGVPGGNRNLAAPVLSSAVVTTGTAVSGTYNGANGVVFQLDFYSDGASGGNAQAQTYLGSKPFTGTGSSSGFVANLGALLPLGRSVTATATDPAGNTSQLSTGVAVTMTSSVNDGIPDAWRAKYFGGSGTTTNTSSTSAADPDHDGMSNYQEFLAGTNPTNAASVLTVIGENPVKTTNAVAVSTISGIVYRVFSRDDLISGSWNILADQVIGNGTNLFLSDPAASATPKRFYRAEVLW